jgi:hypothetical protein
MAGERRTRPETAIGLDRRAATTRPEVGRGPDGRAPPASDRAKKKEGTRCWAGGREKWASFGRLPTREEKKASGLGGFVGRKKIERGKSWAG